MRRTGKLYTLTIISSLLAVLASVLIIFWNKNTSQFHLWLDIVPQGFGMASFITTTLIVSSKLQHLIRMSQTSARMFQAMVSGVRKEDMAVATGSEWLFCYFRPFIELTTLFQLHIYLEQQVKCSASA